jgi:molybdenum cofactor cytidylyltransferase
MGRQKLTLAWKGRTVLECTVSAMTRAGVAGTLVVIGPEEKELKLLAENAGADVLELAHSTAEMRETIERGLEWIEQRHLPEPADGLLLLPADHPSVDVEVVQQILAAHPSESGHSIVIPTFQGRRGHPVWIGWQHVPKIRNMPTGSGLNVYLRHHLHDALLLPVLTTSVLWDLDTPEDLTNEPRG